MMMLEAFFVQYGHLLVPMIFGAILAVAIYLPLSSGQLSLATPGFYAIGGYVAAVASASWQDGASVLGVGQASYPLAYVALEIALAAAICGILGLLIGLPILRLNSVYLAIATMSFAEVVRIVALNLPFTGGAIGIFNIPQPFSSAPAYLQLAVPLLVLIVVAVRHLEQSKIGRAWAAIREDTLAASSCGIDPTYYKVAAFALGSSVAGMAGAVAAHYLNTWNSRQGTFEMGIISLAALLVGGSKRLLGAVIGGMLLTILPELLRELGNLSVWNENTAHLLRDGRMVVFGAMLVASLMFFPQGMVKPALSLKRWRWRSGKAAGPL